MGRLILFFDGACGLCNRSVDFVLRYDRQERFAFAPLQGQTAREVLGPDAAGSPTLILLDGQTLWTRSSAVARIGYQLGGAWKLMALLFWCIPRPIRDALYDFVALRRHQWFGQGDSCRLPSPRQRSRFLN